MSDHAKYMQGYTIGKTDGLYCISVLSPPKKESTDEIHLR